MAPNREAVRRECYRRIVEVMKRGLTEYYKVYPQREGDQRSDAAADWSMRGIRQVLEVLQDYDLTRRK